MSGRRADALRGAATALSLAAEERARRALTDLDRRGAAITFQAVAAEAGVAPASSTATHSCAPRSSNSAASSSARHRSCLGASARAKNRSARGCAARSAENKRLRDENAQLREELALAHGHVRELQLERRAGGR